MQIRQGASSAPTLETAERASVMRAIVRQQFGGPEQLVIQEIPVPEAIPGHVVIEVKAFGINHAETYMRKGE